MVGNVILEELDHINQGVGGLDTLICSNATLGSDRREKVYRGIFGLPFLGWILGEAF